MKKAILGLLKKKRATLVDILEHCIFNFTRFAASLT